MLSCEAGGKAGDKAERVKAFWDEGSNRRIETIFIGLLAPRAASRHACFLVWRRHNGLLSKPFYLLLDQAKGGRESFDSSHLGGVI